MSTIYNLIQGKEAEEILLSSFYETSITKIPDKDIQAEKSIDLYPHEHSGKNTQQNNFKSNKA